MSRHVCPDCGKSFFDDEVPVSLMVCELHEHHRGNLKRDKDRNFVDDMAEKVQDAGFTASLAQVKWIQNLYAVAKDMDPKDYTAPPRETIDEQLGKSGF
jgi:hypothetical protein